MEKRAKFRIESSRDTDLKSLDQLAREQLKSRLGKSAIGRDTIKDWYRFRAVHSVFVLALYEDECPLNTLKSLHRDILKQLEIQKTEWISAQI